MRPQNTEYFGPVSYGTWRDGTGFIESANYMLTPIEYVAPDCKVLLAFSYPHVRSLYPKLLEFVSITFCFLGNLDFTYK